MDKMTASSMRNYNRKQVFNAIYHQRQLSRQQIAEMLHLSLPTVTQDLRCLEEAHLIERNGFFQSTGGRKSVIYSCVSNTRVAIGVQIQKYYLRIVAVDIYGSILRREQVDLEYAHDPEYYRTVAQRIDQFVRSLNLSAKRILGVGIALMALLSRDRQTVTKSVLLGETSATLADFKEWIHYPCQLFHDSEASANAELWLSPGITDALYLGLDHHLNGMLIVNGKLHVGKEYTGGLVEHMTLYPDGRPCYCGKKGCLTRYCSAGLLFDEQGSEPFFQRLRSGDPEATKAWQSYTHDLAMAIGSMYALLDCDIILGGTVARHMVDSDLRQLQQAVRSNSLYAPVSDFISLGHSDVDICACGAAIPYIAEFLENV